MLKMVKWYRMKPTFRQAGVATWDIGSLYPLYGSVEWSSLYATVLVGEAAGSRYVEARVEDRGGFVLARATSITVMTASQEWDITWTSSGSNLTNSVQRRLVVIAPVMRLHPLDLIKVEVLGWQDGDLIQNPYLSLSGDR